MFTIILPPMKGTRAMNIIFLSDIHGELGNTVEVLERYKDSCEAVIFTGDGLDDMKIAAHPYNYQVFAVAGNYDEGIREMTFTLAGKKFYICHGNLCGVKENLDTLKAIAMSYKADLCLFGHSHIPYYEEENSMIIANSGSIGNCKAYKKYTYSIICIDGDNVSIKFYDLDSNKPFSF